MELDSIINANQISNLTDIVGEVNDINLDVWKLEIAEFGKEEFTQIASGDNTVSDEKLASIDPNKLNNGFYQLRLTATDISGRTSTTNTVVEINSTAKTSAYTRTETDLTYTFEGRRKEEEGRSNDGTSSLPLSLTRSYNSLDNTWRFSTDTDIQTNVTLTGREELGVYEPYRIGTRLYLNTPTGERVGFTFSPKKQEISGLTYYSPEWVADTGVEFTLSSAIAKLVKAGNRFYELNTGFAYNPASGDFNGAEFTLTAADGTQYLIDSKKGITEQIAPNGISLVYSDSGITSSTGETVQFVSNEEGLLKEIIAPDGTKVVYDYQDGNLVAARNLSTGKVQRYSYNDSNLNVVSGNPGSNGESITYGEVPQITDIQRDLGGVVQWNGFTVNGNSTGGIEQYTFGLRRGEIESTATGIVLVSAEVTGGGLPSIAGLTPVAQNGNYALFAIDTPGLNLISLTPSLSHSLTLKIAGDLDGNGTVDGADSNILTTEINGNNYVIDYDLNRDGVLNAADMQILGSNYGFAANRAPIVTPTTVLTHTDLEAFLDLDKLATDPEGDPIYFRLADSSNGSVSFTPDGKSVRFTPEDGYFGVGSFDLIADDGFSTAAPVTIRVDVSDAPLINLDIVNRSPRLDKGESTELVVIGDFADQDDVILPASYLTFGSESGLVADINQYGVLSGISDGVEIVSVRKNGIEAVTAVRVGDLDPTNQEELYQSIAENYGLNIYPGAVTLTQGVDRQIFVALNEVEESPDLRDDSTGTRYFVSNPDIIKVTEDGLITALAEEGTANVTVIYGAAEEIIPVRIDKPISGGEATITVDGGVVQDGSGATVMVAPGALSEDTTVGIKKLTESQLGLPVPEGFEFASAFQLDIEGGNNAFGIPAQIAVPAPDGVKVGQEVFFLRQGELPTEDGSLKSYWFIEESGIVGADGMIRTSSPPWPGVSQEGTYTVAVPKFTYPKPDPALFERINAVADEFKYNLAIAIGGIVTSNAGVAKVGLTSIGMNAVELAYLSYQAELLSIPVPTVDVIAIPKVGKLPYITEAGVQINPNGTASVKVDLSNVINSQVDAFKPPVITGAELSYQQTGEPIVYITASNAVVKTDEISSYVENVIVNFDYLGKTYQGEVLKEESKDLGNNLYRIAVKPPEGIILGESYINVIRQQEELVGPIFEQGNNSEAVSNTKTVEYESERSINLETEDSNLVLVAQVWKDSLTAINPDRWNDIQGDEKLTSFDLIAARDIEVGTGGLSIPDRPREVAITADGNRAYVTLENSHSIAVVDTLMLRQVDINPETEEMDTIALYPGAAPRELVISPDDNYVYISDRANGSIYIVDINPNSQNFHKLVKIIGLPGNQLRKLAISADGKRLFVTSHLSETPGKGSIHVINIDPLDRPVSQAQPNTRKWHELIGTIQAESRTEGIATTPEVDKMVFTNGGNDAKGFGLLTITDNDPTNFKAETSYINVGIGSAFDYFDVNDARSVVVTNDGKYGFVGGFNGRNLAVGVESISGPLAGSNIGIIKDPLTKNAKMVAATRPIPMGLTTDLVLNGGNNAGGYIENKYLYAAYPGVGSVFGFDVEKIIATIEKASTDPNIDLTKKPIDEINPDILIAGDLKPSETNRGGTQFGTPGGSKRPPLGIGNNPWGLGSVSKRDWLNLKEVELEQIAPPAPPPTLPPTLPPIPPTLPPIGNPPPILAPPELWIPILIWQIIDTFDVVEVNLTISTHPENKGLFPGEKGFVEQPSPVPDEKLKRTKDGVDDYNPYRVLTATWTVVDLKNNLGQWKIGGEAIAGRYKNNEFPFTKNLNLTGGQKYYWGIEAKSKTGRGNKKESGEFYLPLPNPITDKDKTYSSVTFLTPDGTRFDDNGIASVRKIAESIVDNSDPNQKDKSKDGTIMQYEPSTGEWRVISGDKGFGKPLALIGDWTRDSAAINYNSGFAEGAADSMFASLVNLNQSFEETQKDALFNSPFHFVGFGRGAVVNSEIVQRLGTFFPKPQEPDNEQDPNYGNKDKFPDLHMTTIDPNDFEQLSSVPNNNYRDPKIHIWENVTFGDNYYQTATNVNPRGRDIENQIPEDLLPEDSIRENRPDLTVHLGGQGNSQSRTGFTLESEDKNPHARTVAWYGGTTNLSWGKSNPLNSPTHRRQGDFSYNDLYDPNFPDAQPWYEANHSGEKIVPEIDVDTDTTLQTEGVGNGWYYSLLGNGSSKRAELPTVETVRTPVIYDNTAAPRMRGDFAVPTLFNGNFDAITNRMVDQAIPGWSLHGANNEPNQVTKQVALRTWEDIGVENRANYPNNFALELSSGQNIVHNRFVVPDWGVLRFDLHARNASNNSQFKIYIKSPDTSIWEQLDSIYLRPVDNEFLDNNVGYYDYYPNIGYVDPYTDRISYGATGFETFNLNLPDEWRGKIAELKFEAEGSKVYLDNVFFKSQHILLGNPSNARRDADNYRQNYLIERPQFTVSYNSRVPGVDGNNPENWNGANGINGPNWVSWQLNESWLGARPIKRPKEYPGFLNNRDIPNYPPENLYSATKLRNKSQGLLVSDYPWVSDQTLPDGLIKTESPDYKSNFLDRGHMVPSSERNRIQKDNFATFFTTNMLPQHADNNRVGSAWRGFEEYNSKLVEEENTDRELYIIAGGYSYPSEKQRGFPERAVSNGILFKDGVQQTDENGRPRQASDVPRRKDGDNWVPLPGYTIERRINPKEILVPEWTWKVVVILEAGQGIADIDSETQLLAIMTPNKSKRSASPDRPVIFPMPGGADDKIITNWGNWRQWRVSARYIEQLTGLNFLSHIPQKIQDIIEVDDNSSLPISYNPSDTLQELQNRSDDEVDLAAPLLVDSNVTFVESPIKISPIEVSSFQSSFGHIDSTQISVLKIGSDKASTERRSIFEVSPFQISPTQIDLGQGSISQIRSFQNSVPEKTIIKSSISQIGLFKISSTQISRVEISKPQIGFDQITSSQISSTKDTPSQIGSTQISSTQINPTQISVSQLNPTKISLPSSITLQQLLSSHNLPLDITNTFQNNPLNLTLEITDLPTGQLAEAQVTEFTDQGIPNGGKILIDHNANGLGWFIDPTPFDHSEFSHTLTDTALLATADSEAHGKYDLLTTILHELGHLAGFISGYNEFDRHIQTINGKKTFVADNFTATLSSDGSHLDSEAHPYDLMNTTLRPGVRKLPSLLNLQILNALRSEGVREGESEGILTAPLTSTPLIGINNGTFDTQDTWSTRGAANIIEGQAVLTEESRLNSSFTQNFIIPDEAKYLQFTILESSLTPTLPHSLTPNDAFEVALLNNQNLSLAGTAAGLTQTDALLNIQHDGDAYFSDKVNISGATSSGNQIDLNVTRTVTIDISHINANTEATLYFDLLGFGDKESRVIIDNVRILTDDILIPTANNDTATTNQGKPVTINVLDNDVDPDGTINPSTIQIESAPVNGNITINDDGTITYNPSGNATADTFTYTVKDNDNNTSNTATVNITINNSAPSIREIIVEPNLAEGIAATFSANATDEGEVTYSWNFGDNTPELSGQSVTHTFLDNGIYTATLTVTDSLGASTVETLTLNVNNIAPTVRAGEDQTTIENQAITFNGNYTDPGILDTHSIRWEFGDGSVLVSEGVREGESERINYLNPTHTYVNPGTYTATLTVTDKDGGSSSDTLQIQVNNAAPTITEITGDTQLSEGDTTTFTAAASSQGTDTLTYTWDFGDGTVVRSEGVREGESEGINLLESHTYKQNGNYTVTLTVENQGGSTQQTLTVNVDNVSPIVEAGENQITLQGTTVNFNGSFTDPGILDTHTIEWDFGDGNVLKSEGVKEGESEGLDYLNPTYTYEVPGTYNVTLTITDSDGASTQDTLIVTVNNAAPVITEITGDTNISEGDIATFSANATDPGNDNLTYAWNFGDGTVIRSEGVREGESEGLNYLNPTHTYKQNGTYTVTLTVEDENGASTQQTLTVQVNNVAPTVTAGDNQTTSEGNSITFNGNFSDPGILDTHTFEWDFGDGKVVTDNLNPTHTYTQNGNYTVTLTVTDSDGAKTQGTLVVQVDNVAPTITEITGDTVINEGDTANYTATVTDPGNDTLTYTWNFGDGTDLQVGKTVNHKFVDNGTYTLTLTVTDSDGASTTQTQTVQVNNIAPTVNAGIDQTISEGESVTFNGNFSDPGILDTHTIKWDFGDGNAENGNLNPTHTYTVPGTYTATLTVTDNGGASTQSTLTVQVNNIPPQIIDIPVPDKVYKQDPTDFTATATDPGSQPLTYTWDFGDGTELKTGENVTHTYAESGEYQATLTVTDTSGASDSKTVTVYVGSTPPNTGEDDTDFPDWDGNWDDIFANAPQIKDIPVPDKVYKQEPISLIPNINNPQNQDLTYTWDFGDGTNPVQEKNVTHTYTNSGEYQTTLTITDTFTEEVFDIKQVKVNVGSTIPTTEEDNTDFPDWDGSFDDIFTGLGNEFDDFNW